ncbi:hypothetical protein RUM44_003002 [Polyplax serrata]|uniref:Uncharacterized protein n=1 Tax=Polyplax serrata TaxID=468196 RepID=A0ABR1AXX6_POLSC
MDLEQSLPLEVNPSPISEVGSKAVIHYSNTPSEEEKWRKLFELSCGLTSCFATLDMGKQAKDGETTSNNLLLKPNQLQRQAHSMDSTFYDNYLCFTPPAMRLPREQSRRSAESKESFEMELGFNAGVGGSQTSMALDLHECQVTLKVQDEAANKRSDTSRRHLLLRQKPVEDDNEDRYPRCACIPRFLYTPRPEDCTKINTRFPKNQHSFPRDDARIFYVEDHTRQVNLSSENIRMCDEKLRCLRKHLPYISPHRSLNFSYDCRVQKETGSECLVHTTKDSGRKKKYPLVRSNARRRKCSQKIEGSLSAEEQNSSLVKDKSTHTTRSASFSPTFPSNLCKSSSSSRNDSVIRSPSPVATSSTSQTATELSKEETLESVEDEIKVESQKLEKQPEEPS